MQINSVFIIVFILMIFFWYFVSAFCAVFPKYQNIFLTDSGKSLVLVMLFPFLFVLGIAVFRYLGLRKKSKCSFYVSKIINIV